MLAMGKLTVFDIKLDNVAPSPVFYPGQVVSGHVVVELSEELESRGIRLEFRGEANVHWSEKCEVSTSGLSHTVKRYYGNNQTYFFETKVLFGVVANAKAPILRHPQGKHTYPFKFKLDENLPTSVELERGEVRYWLKAVFERPRFDFQTKKVITILNILDLNLLPDAKNVPKVELVKTLHYFCCINGPIIATLSTDRKGYVPGEFIRISGDIRNLTNREIQYAYVELRMSTVCISRSRKSRMDRTISKFQNVKVGRSRTHTWTDERLFIPPLPPSLLPNCDIIDIYYSVVMVIKPGGIVRELTLPLDIYIGTMPLKSVPGVFAVGPCPFSLNLYRKDEITGMKEAPVSGTLQAQTPMSSFSECVLGKAVLVDNTDDENTRGDLTWSPVYPYYSWHNKSESEAS